MATLTFKTLKEWGMDTFCVQDYIGYIEDARKEDKHLGPVWGAANVLLFIMLFVQVNTITQM